MHEQAEDSAVPPAACILLCGVWADAEPEVELGCVIWKRLFQVR